MCTIRPVATNIHTEKPGMGNPKLDSIPVQGKGHVLPTAWLIRYSHCSSYFHSMSSIQTRRRTPPQINAKARVHYARPNRPSWLPEVGLGFVRGDTVILILSAHPGRDCWVCSCSGTAKSSPRSYSFSRMQAARKPVNPNRGLKNLPMMYGQPQIYTAPISVCQPLLRRVKTPLSWKTRLRRRQSCMRKHGCGGASTGHSRPIFGN